MDTQTSGEVKAEAEVIYRSWLEKVDLFFKEESGLAILAKHPDEDMKSVVKEVFALRFQTPSEASAELREEIKKLRGNKEERVKGRLRSVMYMLDQDLQFFDRVWGEIFAQACGNVSAIKGMAPPQSFRKPEAIKTIPVAQSQKTDSRVQPSTIPAPMSELANGPEARPALSPPTVRCEAGDLTDAEIRKFFELAGDVPAQETESMEKSPAEIRPCLPPPRPEDEAPEIEVVEEDSEATENEARQGELNLGPEFEKSWDG